ncbi:hypothetical protein CAP31_03795 [Sulfuriferula sp. AH1]|uniref:TraR/DksA C4-type zinc finger protein n=1 Tax=Sulfuriferula sp. AH1 TaxID=1985873 RepID=UPI000B3B4A84|nr:TraR/DksA C4-type zinc finger protein [Sulfuriferula sp. AH1]ARU30885.1 hypothetical protein CAP31_03795 [Sulfuriferula sp. AH1]
MDAFDRAQALELEEYERRQRAAILPNTLTESAIECVECETPIPEARRLAVPGVQLCITCQTRLELVRKINGERHGG